MIVKFCLHAALILAALAPVATAAEPARVIILRHGEKQELISALRRWYPAVAGTGHQLPRPGRCEFAVQTWYTARRLLRNHTAYFRAGCAVSNKLGVAAAALSGPS